MTDYQPPAAPQDQIPQGYVAAPQIVMVEKKRNGLATASMVLGIIALVFCWIPFLNVLSYLLAAIAIGLGIAGLIRASKHKVGLGMAIAGLIMALGSVFAATVVNTATVEAIDETISEITTEADDISVTFAEPTTNELGFTTVEVTVTNTSDQEQSPWISVSAESADGSTQYDTGDVIISDLAAGQTTTQTVMFTEDIPADAEFVVTGVV